MQCYRGLSLSRICQSSLQFLDSEFQRGNITGRGLLVVKGLTASQDESLPSFLSPSKLVVGRRTLLLPPCLLAGSTGG